MRKLGLIAVLAVAGAVAGGASYWYLARPNVPRVSSVAPVLSFTTIDGQSLSLASLSGRWVLVNFWASWCAPCMDELPHLVQAQADYGSLGLQIVGPALDDAAAVRPVMTRFKINYPVSADFASGNAAMRALGNDNGALPFSVLIDPEGFIVEHVLGAMSPQQLDGMLRRHLGRS